MKSHRSKRRQRNARAAKSPKRLHRLIEALEVRSLLAADASPTAWHNPYMAEDVDGDFTVAPADVLSLLDAIKRVGIGPLQSGASAFAAGQYLDVTADGLLAPDDVLQVLDLVNLADPEPEEMRLTPQLFDVAGNPITEIVVGTDFFVGLVAEDISSSPATPVGVLSAFADIKLDNPALASFVANPLSATTEINFSATYPDNRVGSLNLAAREVNDAGALGVLGNIPATPDPVVIFTTAMKADAAGLMTFSTDASEDFLNNDLLLYDSEDEPATPTFLPLATLTAVTEAAPNLSIGNVTVNEGNAGTSLASFTVTLSAASTRDVYVLFSTSNLSASAGEDYVAQTSGTLTFLAGDTIASVNVTVNGDAVFEGDETFNVNLLFASNATIADGVGQGTITEDDAAPLLSVSNAQLAEDGGNMIFTVSLSQASTVDVIVGFSTQDNTALAGLDYTAQSGQLTFPAGITQLQVAVPITNDPTPEPDETFFLVVSSPVNALIDDDRGVGTILANDGGAPVQIETRFEIRDAGNNIVPDGGTISVGDSFTFLVYVDDVSAADEGVLAAYLDVVYTAAVLGAVGPFSYNPLYDTARQGDFSTDGLLNEAGASNLNGAPGPAEVLLFSIPMIAEAAGVATLAGNAADDVGNESGVYPSTPVPPNQIFFDTYTLNVAEVVANSFSINNVSVAEGDAGTTAFTFTVTRNNPTADVATVQFATGNGTATLADGDYNATNGTLTFNIGDTTETITVLVNGDTKNEADETFSVTLSNPANATIGTGTGAGTILNDDAAPTVSIADATGPEGSNLQFTVTLSAISGQQVTVPFSTQTDGGGANPATSGTDFTPTSGVLTFAPGVTVQTVSVAALSDLTSPEADETFLVNLGTPITATIADGSALGTIQDAPPAGATGYVYVDANNDGVKAANEVGIPGVIVTVTSDDGLFSQTTTTGADGSYQFFNLPANQYFITETQPGFYSDGLDTPSGLVVANDRFFVDLVADPSISDLNFGETGILPEFLAVALNRRIFFSTTLNDPINGLYSPIVNANLTKGDIWVSFDAGWDGLRKFQAYFPQGSTTLKLYDLDRFGKLHLLATSKLVNGIPEISWVDSPETPAKPLFLQITGTSTNASVKIIDTLRVVPQSVPEGNAGVTNQTLTVKLSAPQTAPVVVEFATANDVAISPNDLTAVSGTLTFAAGETSKTITVPIVGDLLDEDNETFLVNLTGASSFVEVAPGPFKIAITDDDQLPRVNITDVAIAEGAGGTTNAVFNVILSSASGREVTVAYTTAAGSATAGGDFTPVTGTVTFAPGTLAQPIAVPILGDTFLEPNETFNVVLGSAVNASILDGVGLGTITNDDAGPQFLPPPNLVSGGLLASTESSESSTAASATTTPEATSTAVAPTGGYTRPISSRGRSATRAVDAALAEEEDWLLVA